MQEAYAHALWQMVESGTSPKEAVRKVHASLAARGREALLPRVASAFRRLAERERVRSGITLSVAREKDARAAMHEAKDLLASLSEEKVGAEVIVDGSLVGGWRLEGRETLVDASFKKQLLSLYNRATQ